MEYKNGRSDVDMSDILKIIIKKKWFILIFTITLSMFVFICLNIFLKDTINIFVETQDLYIVIKGDNKNDFSELDFIKYVKKIDIEELEGFSIGHKSTLYKNTPISQQYFSLIEIKQKIDLKEDKNFKLLRGNIEDFLNQFGMIVFREYFFDLKKRLNILNIKITDKNEKVKELNRKITVLNNYKDIDNESYKEAIPSVFLPPKQQYYGTIIERDLLLNSIKNLEEELQLITEFVSFLRSVEIKKLSDLINLKITKKTEKFFKNFSVRMKILINVIEKYSDFSNVKIENSSKYGYLIVFVILFFTGSFCLVILFEWIKRIKTK